MFGKDESMRESEARDERIASSAKRYLGENAQLRELLGIPADAILDIELLGMGEHNVNYLFRAPLGRKFVLRVNVASQPFHKNQILYEYEALRSAEPSGCTPKPLFVDYSEKVPGKGILVEEYCDGIQLDFDHLRPGDVRCAIQMMADVHSVAPSADCKMHRPKDPLLEMLEECKTRFRDYLSSGFEEERLVEWMRAFLDVTERYIGAMAPPEDCNHIINTETLPSHFLIPESSAEEAAGSGSTGRLCTAPGHFVDWERSILGEIAQDVAYFVSPTTTYWDSEFLFPPQRIPEVLDEYWQAVDGRFAPRDFEVRFKAWRMMTALKSTSWCLQAVPRYSQDLGMHTTEKIAGKLPVYLSEEFMERIASECFGL